MPIFLCLFHVFEAWLDQVRKKLFNKGLFTKVMQVLKTMVYSRPLNGESPSDMSERLIGQFKEMYADEERIEYFERHWEGKKGMFRISTDLTVSRVCCTCVFCIRGRLVLQPCSSKLSARL